jgi:hypothetical protein
VNVKGGQQKAEGMEKEGILQEEGEIDLTSSAPVDSRQWPCLAIQQSS